MNVTVRTAAYLAILNLSVTTGERQARRNLYAKRGKVQWNLMIY